MKIKVLGRIYDCIVVFIKRDDDANNYVGFDFFKSPELYREWGSQNPTLIIKRNGHIIQ